ncbi:hypothetical protein GCM10009784_00830 [Arthrobacter parietis]|uniref:Uncharacterized protein n=1 Tax=Arthrobacter parietis TaxID=271434 RepID=A0ABN3AMF7_9MICC
MHDPRVRKGFDDIGADIEVSEGLRSFLMRLFSGDEGFFYEDFVVAVVCMEVVVVCGHSYYRFD